MIDCLSNPSWINPQTDFLLILQNMRIGNLEVFDKFFLSVTVFGEFWLPTIVCAIFYWCIDFRAGIYLFSLEGFNILFAHLFKMLACVYRPWVLDNRIHPSALAVPFAKGYSFPSGHSAMSSSVFGGVAYLLRKNKLICGFFIFIVLLVGFSRLWLGVHTPQDVLGGFLIGLTLIFAVEKMINWAEKDKNRYLYLLLIINVFAIFSTIYLYLFNTYRIDYVSGQLLVNPQDLKYVLLVVYSYSLGMFNGCFLCRRFFPFNPKEGSVKRRILRGIVGVIGAALLIKFIFQKVFLNIVDYKLAVSLSFMVGISITLIYPIIFVNVENFITERKN